MSARQTQNKDLSALMNHLGQRAQKAARLLARLSSDQKNDALREMARQLRLHKASILKANHKDIEEASTHLTKAKIDRLALDESRIEAMASGLEDIAQLDDPIGKVMAQWTRPNGLAISRIHTPLGVIGMIFESRPNVNADAGGLCVKSGNAVILRPGSESRHSSTEIHHTLQIGLSKAGLPEDAILLAPLGERKIVDIMLQGLDGKIDVIVPRGGRGLVERVQKHARVPVFAHLEGICHIYVDEDANLDMARKIVLNSKMRRTGICGAAETLLLHRDFPKEAQTHIINDLLALGCQIRGCPETQKISNQIILAQEEDWKSEYLDAIISVKQVKNIADAISHIESYGSHHTETIITDNQNNADIFLNQIDSAIVMHNSSTQFADGGEFGMGAEIGISTGKFHARGPIGVEQLTSFKYIVRGQGQCRP